MCEIAIFPISAREQKLNAITAASQVLYDENPHGFGAVAIHAVGGEDRFGYAYYKATEPTWDGRFREFLADNTGAWRLVVHARYATAGENNVVNAHPLLLDCDETDVDAIIHNGVVNNHKKERQELIEDGHEFSTGVDSEVIAHKHGAVPESLDEMETEPDLTGSLNYLLFAENGILVRTKRKYRVTSDFRMTCRRSDFGIDRDDAGSPGWRLVKPDKSVEYASFSEKRPERESRVWTDTARTSVPTSGWAYVEGEGWTSKTGDESEDTKPTSTGGGRRSSQTVARGWAQGRRRGSHVEPPGDGDDDEQSRDPDVEAFYAGEYGYCEEHSKTFRVACPTCMEEFDTDQRSEDELAVAETTDISEAVGADD